MTGMCRQGIKAAAVLIACTLVAACGGGGKQPADKEAAKKPIFNYQQVMIPMRDGSRLQTVILTPIEQHGPLPILLRRSPYGVPEPAEVPKQVPPSLKELMADGYIFVTQNVRGRFKSEGTFAMLAIPDLDKPETPNEAADAYDSIDWLVKNVPHNNGNVGILGTSYDAFLAAICLVQPHPALKAISEQASPVDQWMNDDIHHFGALRESYAIEYSVMEQADKNKNTHFDFKTYDTYQWYLDLGPLANVDREYLHGSIPYWNYVVAHPDYDASWKRQAWVNQLHGAMVPNLNVAGFWDQEDPWGPWQIFEHAGAVDPSGTSFMLAGPWHHGQWSADKAESIGVIPFGGHDTAVEFREIRAAFFRYYLHGRGTKPAWRVTTFQSGSNSWRTYQTWPPREASITKLFLHADGTLSFTAPEARAPAKPYREYVSDPSNPVPYRQRPISPTYPGGDWPTWEAADQRFADHRTDVLSYVSAPLEKDIRVTGPIAARLFASTSGTDSDFIVKLIDVFPEAAQKKKWKDEDGPNPGQYAQSLNGYELPIAMEVRRGRYLHSYEAPHALTANKPLEWDIPLRDHDHVFLKGHRMMVQIQSTWFPLIDRNPQKFVPNIYQATATDFVPATQRVYSSSAMPSHLALSVMP